MTTHKAGTQPVSVHTGMLLRHPYRHHGVWRVLFVRRFRSGDSYAVIVPAWKPSGLNVDCRDIQDNWLLAADFTEKE